MTNYIKGLAHIALAHLQLTTGALLPNAVTAINYEFQAKACTVTVHYCWVDWSVQEKGHGQDLLVVLTGYIGHFGMTGLSSKLLLRQEN